MRKSQFLRYKLIRYPIYIAKMVYLENYALVYVIIDTKKEHPDQKIEDF